MRIPLRLLPSVVLLLLSAPPLAAQDGGTSLLAGYGGIDHEGSLGPAVHVNLRYRLVAWGPIPLAPPGPRRAFLPRFEVQAEAFAQAGRSGTRLSSCRAPRGRLCSVSADPLHLLGAGLVTHTTLTSVHHPVRVYFLPLTAAVYLRGYELHEGELGSLDPVHERQAWLAGGIGNGFGVDAAVGRARLLVEVRAVLIRDLGGARGGSLPISVGVAW